MDRSLNNWISLYSQTTMQRSVVCKLCVHASLQSMQSCHTMIQTERFQCIEIHLLSVSLYVNICTPTKISQKNRKSQFIAFYVTSWNTDARRSTYMLHRANPTHINADTTESATELRSPTISLILKEIEALLCLIYTVRLKQGHAYFAYEERYISPWKSKILQWIQTAAPFSSVNLISRELPRTLHALPSKVDNKFPWHLQ